MSTANTVERKGRYGGVDRTQHHKRVQPGPEKVSRTQPVFPAQQLLLQRKGNHCPCGGSCPKCQNKLAVQPKLKVGAVSDKYEQEADRVAEQVVNGGASSAVERDSNQSKIQRMCSNCDEKEDDDENQVQRKSASDEKTTMPSDTESYIQSLGTGGAPLSRSEANYFEPRFGRSFSDIRIHNGDSADKAARSINARAFTLGNNIAFANGEYDSSSVSGRKLMAHELTHTLQQSSGDHSVQRGSAGILGGKCCNTASRVEWALVGEGVWKKLGPDECTGTTEDCDGMTCGGGFYHVDNLQTGSCNTPRNDDPTFASRRWTPTSQGTNAHSPTAEGGTQGDTPPSWEYDSAATTACPNGVRTISVDLVTLYGSSQSPTAQLAVANTVFSGCCVRFVAGATPAQESQATTEAWLGGDTELKWHTQCGLEPEEQAMWDGATSTHNLSSRMRVFFVETLNPTTARAYSRPPFCATGAAAPYVNHAVIPNNALNDTLAHELGHILINSGDHTGIDNPADTRNLMFAPGRTASDLDASQCAVIYRNA
jgi:Domain of unknown function (DUF4157)